MTLPRSVLVGLAAILVVAIGFVVSYRVRHNSTGTTVDKTLRIPILSPTAITTLDPIQSVEIAQYDVCNQIFEGLVTVDNEGHFAAGLAERWTSSEDYKLWRFYLRDARFSDNDAFVGGIGRAVTAEDVLYSLKRGLSPKQGSKGSFALSRSVVGASEYAAEKADDVTGLRTSEPGVIEIELKTGDRFFPAALTVPATYVVPKEAVEKYGAQFGRNPVGSGPFMLRSWTEGHRLVLERNPHFGTGKGKQPPAAFLPSVELQFFRSEPQVASAFNAGDIDLRPVVGADILNLKGDDIVAELQARNPKVRVVQPGWLLKLHLVAVQMGPEHPLGTDSTARQALFQTLVPKLTNIAAFRGVGNVQRQILPDRFLVTESRLPRLTDPRAELRKHVEGKEIRIAYASTRINDIIARALESVLTDAGARPVLFPSTSVNALFGSLGDVKPDLTLIYWSPYVPNVSEFLTALLSTSRPVPNFTGFTSPQLDQLSEELRTGKRPDKEVIADIQLVLDTELPWVPLYIEVPYYLTSDNVESLSLSPVSVTQLRSVRKN